MKPNMKQVIMEKFGFRQMTADEVSKYLGYSFSRTSRAITALRREGAPLRIAKYRPPPGAGLWTPVYAIGTQADAPMPDHNTRAKWRASGEVTEAPVVQQTWLSALGMA